MSIRVLIVDDSVVFRSQIRAAFDGVEGFKVVGTAENGKVALERLKQLEVDLVTVDLEMPEMGGIELLRAMRAREHKAKAIVFSSTSKRGAEGALEALNGGASDFIEKPSAVQEPDSPAALPYERIRTSLMAKIVPLFNKMRSAVPKPATSTYEKILWEVFRPEILVIGSSTGGPTALEEIFAGLKSPLRCPVLIAQHMPPVFTEALAQRLGRISGMAAGEAKDGESLLPGQIYVAPGNFHMRIVRDDRGPRIQLDQQPLLHSVRPAVDHLFESAAQAFGKKCFGLVLTGMGEDGKKGAEQIKRAGGGVMIQSRESCVVFGMPGAVFEVAAYDRIGNLEEITRTLKETLAA